MRAILLTLFLAALIGPAWCNDWADYATVSMTDAVTPKLQNKGLCYSDGRDLLCDGSAGLLLTSGTLSIDTVSASTYYGDGSHLTGISTQGDRITSGTASAIANSSGGYISLTTGSTTWGYLGSSATYLPIMNGSLVSSTNVSVTVGQFTSQTVASIAGGGGNYIVSGSASVSASMANGGTVKIANGSGLVMTVSGSNVGIGTSSPAERLQVQFGNIALNNAYLLKWGSSQIYGYDGTGGYLNFRANGSQNLYLADGGNVGIGTTSPGQALDVTGAIQTRGGYGALPTLAAGLVIGAGGTTPNAASVAFGDHSGWKLNFGANNGGTFLPTVTFLDTGRVGIGTTAPAYTLDVAGAVAGSSAYVNTSDGRLKTDIHGIAYGLADVMRLRPVTFHWKDQKPQWAKGRKLGLIAQEVRRVVPEIVSIAHDTSKTESIAYGDLTPILIKAVQELKADNDNLRAQLARQQQEIDHLKAASK